MDLQDWKMSDKKVNRFVKHVPLQKRNLCCLLSKFPQNVSGLNQVNYLSVTFKNLEKAKNG